MSLRRDGEPKLAPVGPLLGELRRNVPEACRVVVAGLYSLLRSARLVVPECDALLRRLVIGLVLSEYPQVLEDRGAQLLDGLDFILGPFPKLTCGLVRLTCLTPGFSS